MAVTALQGATCLSGAVTIHTHALKHQWRSVRSNFGFRILLEDTQAWELYHQIVDSYSWLARY